MTRTKRSTRVIALGAVAITSSFALSGCGDAAARGGAAIVIGDYRYSISDLSDATDAALASAAAADINKDKAGYQQRYLTSLVQQDLTTETARRQHIEVTDAAVEDQLDALDTEGTGRDALFKSAKAQAGLTEQAVREVARTQAEQLALGDKLTASTPVSAEQLQQAYAAGIDTFDQVRLSVIIVPTLAEAQALLPQAGPLDDAAFNALAQQKSPGQGGDIGLRGRTSLGQVGIPALVTAAFADAPGSTFVIDTGSQGALVVRVVEHRITTPEQAAPTLRRTVLGDATQQALLGALRATAKALKVEVNPRFGYFDEATLSVAPRESRPGKPLSSPTATPAPAASTPAGPAPDGSGQAPTDGSGQAPTDGSGQVPPDQGQPVPEVSPTLPELVQPPS